MLMLKLNFDHDSNLWSLQGMLAITNCVVYLYCDHFFSFFCMHTDLPQESRDKLYDHFKLEDNLIKCQITPKLRKDGIIPPGYQCTLSEELLPPSQRPSVQMLISEGRKAPTARPVNYGPHGKRWVYKEEVIDPTDEKVDLE